MKLSELLLDIEPKAVSGLDRNNPAACIDMEVGSIHYNSKEIQPGGLFVAIPGYVSDGHDYIDAAIENGACAVVSQKPVDTDKNAVIIQVENSRKALAALSNRFYGNASVKMVVIGITGTNGKTTITFLLESILKAAGYKPGVIGTINYRYAGKIFDNPRTTPESLDLQKILSEMLMEGVTHVIIEVASHAIALYRVENTWMDVAVFTNLTQDHLDFHGDIESYWACKKQLFTRNLITGPKRNKSISVINLDDPKGKELIHLIDTPAVSVGTDTDATVFSDDVTLDVNGIIGRISTPHGQFDFRSELIGKYNLENILCATGVGIALNLPLEKLNQGIRKASAIPGRLERIQNKADRFVYVDYAHTPDALENVLLSLKNLATQKIICVFGCGGDRDKGKRPEMGKIAGQLSDLAIITSDNPRSEPPMEIIGQILEGTRSVMSHEYFSHYLKSGVSQPGYAVEPDREKAIALGITVSEPGDIVLIAGKGHETYQILGTKMVPFDDRIMAQKALSVLG